MNRIEEMELQIWEYLDGTATPAQRLLVEKAIATDEDWKSKYDEIFMFHATLKGELELEQTSLRFSKNVMDLVATMPMARPMRNYIDKKIVYLIGSLFGVVLMVLVVMGLRVPIEGGKTRAAIDGLTSYLPSMKFSLHGGYSIGLACIYAVLSILLVDRVIHYLRNSDRIYKV